MPTKNKILERVEYEPDDEYKYGSAKLIGMIYDESGEIYHKIEYKLEYLSEERSDDYSHMLYSITLDAGFC